VTDFLIERPLAADGHRRQAGDGWFEVREEMRIQWSSSYGGISRFFAEIVERSRLLVTRCPDCRRVYCPPRADCPSCWCATQWEPHSGRGRVVAPVYCYWTQINSPVRRYVQPPFVYALVRLDGVENCFHALVEPADVRLNVAVRVGTPVSIRFRPERRGAATDFYFVPDAPDGDGS